MYENYTKQALPERHYRELLGTALYVFNTNCEFIIEIVRRLGIPEKYDWYKLIDMESGRLKPIVSNEITKRYGSDVETLFSDLVERRNRIVHSFGITSRLNQQILATKTLIKDGNLQFEITEEYIMKFIELNDQLSSMLHAIRGY